MRNYIAKNIVTLRMKKKLTQEQLADDLKITRSRLGAYEENRNEPNVDMIIRFSKYFQVPINNLILHKYTHKKRFYKYNRLKK